MLAIEPLSQLLGGWGEAAERSSLRTSCTPLLPPSTLWPPTCACRPGTGFTLQSGLRFHWPSPAPRPQRPRCSQPAMGQAWGGSQGQEGPPPRPPGWVWGGSRSPLSQPKPPAPPWSGPQLEGQPSHLLSSTRIPNHTQAEPRQLPTPKPARHPKSEPLLPSWGHCTDPHLGGQEGLSCPQGRPAATVAWGGAVLCSQDAHPLWSWQAALHQGGRKRARQRQPRFLPPARPPRAQAEQSAFICLLLAASLLTSVRHCLLANRTQTA